MAGVRHGSQERLGPGYQSARSDRGNASRRGRRSREDPCSGALTVAFSLQQRSFLAWFPAGGERGGYASPVARALPTSYWAADRWFFEPGGRPAPPEPAPGPPPMTPGPAPPAPHVFPSTPTPTALRPLGHNKPPAVCPHSLAIMPRTGRSPYSSHRGSLCHNVLISPFRLGTAGDGAETRSTDNSCSSSVSSCAGPPHGRTTPTGGSHR